MEINFSSVEIETSFWKVSLTLTKRDREQISRRIWENAKKLLPYTMGETTFGLVGASKILFSVLPEIVLPVDTKESISL